MTLFVVLCALGLRKTSEAEAFSGAPTALSLLRCQIGKTSFLGGKSSEPKIEVAASTSSVGVIIPCKRAAGWVSLCS